MITFIFAQLAYGYAKLKHLKISLKSHWENEYF